MRRRVGRRIHHRIKAIATGSVVATLAGAETPLGCGRYGRALIGGTEIRVYSTAALDRVHHHPRDAYQARGQDAVAIGEPMIARKFSVSASAHATVLLALGPPTTASRHGPHPLVTLRQTALPRGKKAAPTGTGRASGSRRSARPDAAAT
jgi:hypothetical protein